MVSRNYRNLNRGDVIQERNSPRELVRSSSPNGIDTLTRFNGHIFYLVKRDYAPLRVVAAYCPRDEDFAKYDLEMQEAGL